MRNHKSIFISVALFAGILFFTGKAYAATNVYYSVGQSTSTNLMTGSPTLTLTAGAGVFSSAQTGNIGVGDQVTYGSGTIAYISGKSDTSQLDWSLVTATGSIPANVTNASVTSINRAYASLSAAVSGMKDSNHIATSSLVGANVIVNLPCYYDSGSDTTGVTIASSTITGSSTYLNIYTPNNTSTQANFSQRHTGKWTATGAYTLVVSNAAAIDIRTNYVRVTGLEVDEVNSSTANQRVIRMDNVPGSGGYIVIANNIVQSQMTGTVSLPQGIGENNAPAAPTMVIVNNIIYGIWSPSGSTSEAVAVTGGTAYIYSNTAYDDELGYAVASATISLKDDIVQSSTVGFSVASTTVLDASSTNNLSNNADAPGLNAQNSATVIFVSTSTPDLHLSDIDTAAIGQGANLTNDPNYAFTTDIDNQTRPVSTAWDIGADEYVAPAQTTPPVITAFTLPASSTLYSVSVNIFTATSTVYPIEAYTITESPVAPAATSSSWLLSPPTTFTFGGSGTRTAYAWVEDAYGNISSSTSATVTINPSFTAVNASSGLSAGFFGMHYYTQFPSISFGAVRLWDSGTYWLSLETSSGTYNWAPLDARLAAAASSGIDVLYTFGGTPQWASSQPAQSCTNTNGVQNIGCAAPPSDIGSGDYIWKAFVTALVEHSLASQSAHIKYYELWNEAYDSPYFSGTVNQMVTMATDATTIIHSLDPNAVVLSPTMTSSYLTSYLAAGGANAQDAIAFHSYVGGTNPDAVISRVSGIQAVMNQYGIGNNPIFATEGDWGTGAANTGPTDPSAQSAYLAQEYILLWANNVSRYYWYAYDSSLTYAYGPLWDATSGVHAAGTAYTQLYSWLVGSSALPNPCNETIDSTWYCPLTLADGSQAEIVWNWSLSKSIPSGAFTVYKNLESSAENTIVGNSVTIGNEPILLDLPVPAQQSSGGGGTVGVGQGGGGGGGGDFTYIPPASPNTSTSTTSIASMTPAQLEGLIAQLEAELQTLETELGSATATISFTRNLTLRSIGNDVAALQHYLNTHGFPVHASGPGSLGEETTYFGTATQAALAAFQASVGITPSVGYFGPKTRAWMNGHE